MSTRLCGFAMKTLTPRDGGQPSGRTVPTIHLIILKVASACNLNCTYCYVYNAKDRTYQVRPALLSEGLARIVLSRIKHYCSKRPLHRVSVCLHGGEPLLLGKDRFRTLVNLVRDELGECLGSLAVQTNGIL